MIHRPPGKNVFQTISTTSVFSDLGSPLTTRESRRHLRPLPKARFPGKELSTRGTREKYVWSECDSGIEARGKPNVYYPATSTYRRRKKGQPLVVGQTGDLSAAAIAYLNEETHTGKPPRAPISYPSPKLQILPPGYSGRLFILRGFWCIMRSGTTAAGGFGISFLRA